MLLGVQLKIDQASRLEFLKDGKSFQDTVLCSRPDLAQENALELPAKALAEFGADENRYVSLDRLYKLLGPVEDMLPQSVEKVLDQPEMYHSALLDALRTAHLMRLCRRLHLAEESSWLPLHNAGDLLDIDNLRFVPPREEASPMERRADLDNAIHEKREPNKSKGKGFLDF